MKAFRTLVLRIGSPSARNLVYLALSCLLVLAPAAPPAQQWVFLRRVQAPPPEMCVGDSATLLYAVTLKTDGPPPLVPTPVTFSAAAAHGTLTPGLGTIDGSALRLVYTATQAGQDAIVLTAYRGSSSTKAAPIHVRVIECEYDITISAFYEKKEPIWWWLTSFEGRGGFGRTGNELQGTGNYDFYVDGLWKSKDETVKCALLNPIEGSSAFRVSGSFKAGSMLVTLDFEPANIPATKYRCVDKEGKASEEPMWGSSSWSPHQEAKFAQLLFSSAGGQQSFAFGQGGMGYITVSRREQ